MRIIIFLLFFILSCYCVSAQIIPSSSNMSVNYSDLGGVELPGGDIYFAPPDNVVYLNFEEFRGNLEEINQKLDNLDNSNSKSVLNYLPIINLLLIIILFVLILIKRKQHSLQNEVQ